MWGIVVGLVAEARLAHGLGGEVAVGVDAAALLARQGVRGLVSFGLAGGLSPELQAGAVIVAEGVVTPSGERWATDPVLSARLGKPAGWMLAASDIIATSAAKREAWTSSHAVAVDMESGAVARLAAQYGLPFAVLRAICDPAGRDLPPAALTALDATGAIRPMALVRSLARYPAQIPALIALGREAARARRALLAQVAGIGPLD